MNDHARHPCDDRDRAEARAWRDAASDPVVSDLLESVFAEVASAIAQRRPLCEVSGRCCRFESYGHRLYVTGLEAAYTLSRLRADLGRDLTPEDLARALAEGGCPFQIEGLCSVHAIKPVACRTFFCDETSEDWQRALTERCQDRLRAIHDLHGVPYRYAEWRALLALLLETESDADAPDPDDRPRA